MAYEWERFPAPKRIGSCAAFVSAHSTKKKKCFILQAPRQTGKTTLLIYLVDKLRSQGNHYAMRCSLESLSEDYTPEKGIQALIWKIMQYAERAGLPNTEILNILHLTSIAGPLTSHR